LEKKYFLLNSNQKYLKFPPSLSPEGRGRR